MLEGGRHRGGRTAKERIGKTKEAASFTFPTGPLESGRTVRPRLDCFVKGNPLSKLALS
jgi:hypothetical protein